MNKFFFFIGLSGLAMLFSNCRNLAFVAPEQELVSYFINDYPLDSRTKQVYTVLTYNIHMGFTDDQNPFASGDVGASIEHLDSLVAAIKSLDPDFVALQDVGRNVTHTVIEDQAAYLAAALEMNFAYSDYSEVNTGKDVFIRGSRGHLLLTKFEIQSIDNIEILNQTRYESRYCQVSNIKINEQRSISLLNTHFRGGAAQEEKDYETNTILEIAEAQAHPIILCGDFNNTLNTTHIAKIDSIYPSVLTLVLNQERLEVETNHTKIDNIFVEDAFFEVQNIGLMKEQYWYLSDHRCLFARFTLK